MDAANESSRRREELERKEAFRNRPMYSSPVKIGNWNEDIFLQEEKDRVAAYKRDSCTLLVQNTRQMFKNLLKPVELSRATSFVQYGLTYQIQACELSNQLVPQSGYKASYGLYLSGLMNEMDITHGRHFLHGCGLTASPDKSPCVRNTFQFVGCDGQEDGQTLYYGDDVYVKIYESGIDRALYVQCENSTIDDFGDHLPVRLTQSPDMYCRFKMLHWDPNLRFETTGSGFAPNTRLTILHTASGRLLAAEYRHWIPTFFGAECVVSCYTYRDAHKMETAENFWKVISAQDPNMHLYVQAAKGEEIPTDLLN